MSLFASASPFRSRRLPEALRRSAVRAGIAEAVVLSTCNRVEFAMAADDDADPYSAIAQFFDSRDISLESLGNAVLPV